MRKIFTTMALAAITLSASATVSYETDPAEGTVQSLKEISFVLTDYGRSAAVILVNGEDQVSIPVTCDGEAIANATAEPSPMFAGLYISLAEEATAAGEYKITIPANTIKVDDIRGAENITEDIVLTYNIGASSADEYFTDYTAIPAEGVVDKLESVWVTVNGAFDIINNPDISPREIIITKDGEPLSIGFSDGLDYDGAYTAYSIITFDEPIAEPGIYEVIFPAGYIKTSMDMREYTPIDKPIKLTYTVGSSSSDENYFTDYTAIPAEGVVDKLESVWVTINGMADVASTFDTNKITIKKDGEPLSIGFTDGLEYDDAWTTYCAITFDEPITEPGTYEVIFGAGYITASQNFRDYEPLDQPIKLTYTIGDNGGDNTGFDFTKFTADPSNETTVDEISTVTMTFDNVDSAECSAVLAYLNEKSVAEENIKITNEGNTVKFEFTPAITEEGNLKITIPNGGMKLNKGEESEVNSAPIELTYAIKPITPVEYVYEFEFSNPKPNENGEISTEKDLQGIQFYVDKAKGLNVPEDLSEETVATMKQTDGEWETTGTISKSYGLNSERSYIIVAWKAQPKNDGEYTITIPQGVMGDEAWLANHKTGKANKETVLTFKLVSPSTAVEDVTVEAVKANGVYNLTGVRVADTLENLPAGIYIYGGKKIVVK